MRRALCHRSWVAESSGLHSNERLEFLGDAVLGWVIADLVFHNYSDQAEGALTDLRKSVVNANALAEVAAELHIGDHLLLGRGEDAARGREKVSILSDAMEAVLGAVYLDRGLPAARKLIERVFRPRMIAYVRGEGERDYKTILQELASAEMRSVPEYRIRERGPDHQKEFTATVFLAGNELGIGIGRSKKEAEQQAAHQAYVRLSERGEPAGAWGGRGAPEASADARAAGPRKKGS